MARKPKPLVVAVPKGRILAQLAPKLAKLGVREGEILVDDRKLVRKLESAGIELLLLKPDDVPTYVEYGAADVGVVGRDTLLERSHDVYVPLDLELGKCRLVVAGLPGTPLEREPLRVATKFPNVTARHFAARGQHVETIYVQGSVELAPLVGLSDVIVDLVESGATLRENGLVVLEEIAHVSSVAIVNRVSFKLHRPAVDRLLGALAPR